MTPIDQLALEAAKALTSKWEIGDFPFDESNARNEQQVAAILAPFLRRAVELGAEQFVPKFVAK